MLVLWWIKKNVSLICVYLSVCCQACSASLPFFQPLLLPAATSLRVLPTTALLRSLSPPTLLFLTQCSCFSLPLTRYSITHPPHKLFPFPICRCPPSRSSFLYPNPTWVHHILPFLLSLRPRIRLEYPQSTLLT